LGSGIASGQTNRNCSGYLIDDHILLDCGPGIWRILSNSANEISSIDKIFITHFHVDHFADLIPILWTRYVLGIEQTQGLSLYGPPGTNTWFEELTLVHNGRTHKLRISVSGLSGKRVVVDGYTIDTLSTFHTQNSICYKLTDSSNTSIFYSGDSGWNDGFVSMAKSCDLAIVEASKPTIDQAPDHLSPRAAGTFAHLAGVKMLLLTHLYPEVLEEDALVQAATEYKGKIALAYDGLTLHFGSMSRGR
jgi:ribonuclease BN (tRNA processing enzyme)